MFSPTPKLLCGRGCKRIRHCLRQFLTLHVKLMSFFRLLSPNRHVRYLLKSLRAVSRRCLLCSMAPGQKRARCSAKALTSIICRFSHSMSVPARAISCVKPHVQNYTVLLKSPPHCWKKPETLRHQQDFRDTSPTSVHSIWRENPIIRCISSQQKRMKASRIKCIIDVRKVNEPAWTRSLTKT